MSSGVKRVFSTFSQSAPQSKAQKVNDKGTESTVPTVLPKILATRWSRGCVCG